MKDHAVFGRGWQVTAPGGIFIRHRLKFDPVSNVPGSGRRLTKDEPPWLLSRSFVHGGRKWFWTLDEAMVWAVNELALRETKELQ